MAINELLPSPIADDAEFLEPRNLTGSPVDVGDWCFTSGIGGCLPPDTMIPADGFLLMVQDEAIARAEWGIPLPTPVYVYSGGQKGSGETITLEDAGAAVADEVTYATHPPWPTEPTTGLASLERINPATASSNAANWAASDPAPTPGAANTAYDPGGGPSFEVTDLVAAPFRPDPAEAVVVTTVVSEPATTIDLTYVVNFDTPVTIAMSLVSGTTYEATIPGQGAGDLVRYRVDADSGTELAARPILGDSIEYEGVVVLNAAITTTQPVLEWFMEDAVYDDLLDNHRFDDVTGAASRSKPKVSWKVDLPSGYLFDMGGMLDEPVDEFNLQRDQWPLARPTVGGGIGSATTTTRTTRSRTASSGPTTTKPMPAPAATSVTSTPSTRTSGSRETVRPAVGAVALGSRLHLPTRRSRRSPARLPDGGTPRQPDLPVVLRLPGARGALLSSTEDAARRAHPGLAAPVLRRHRQLDARGVRPRGTGLGPLGNHELQDREQRRAHPGVDLIGPSNDPGNWGRSVGDGTPGAANAPQLPVIVPGGFIANPEGDVGGVVHQLPVTLSQAWIDPVTIDWNTGDVASNPQIAHPGTDFTAASGAVTFDPGETSATIDIEILGDVEDELPLLWGERGLVQFTGPTNATLDIGTFFGLGLFIIFDDDPAP